MFLSSNPSIDEDEDYPRWAGPLDEMQSHFEDRFDEGLGRVKDGIYPPLSSGGWSNKAVRFWIAVRARTQEVLDEVVPGVDYALTEVVHCKSRREAGVPQALVHCSERYLSRVLEAAETAAVIVVYGSQARAALDAVLGVKLTKQQRYQATTIAGKLRHFVFLDHPAGFGSVKRFATALTEEELDHVRAEARVAQADRDRVH